MDSALTSPKKAVTIVIFTVLLMITGLVSAESSTEPSYETVVNPDVFDRTQWANPPSYAENLDVEIIHTGAVRTREVSQTCLDYNMTELNLTGSGSCIDLQKSIVGRENTYLYNFSNISTAYLGNGLVYLSFVAEPNNLTENVNLQTGSINTKGEAATWFNNKFVYKDGNISTTNFSKLQTLAGNVTTAPMGGEIVGKRIESTNILNGSSRFEFVLRLQDSRHAGISLNDEIGLRVETGIYDGGGVRP